MLKGWRAGLAAVLRRPRIFRLERFFFLRYGYGTNLSLSPIFSLNETCLDFVSSGFHISFGLRSRRSIEGEIEAKAFEVTCTSRDSFTEWPT